MQQENSLELERTELRDAECGETGLLEVLEEDL